MSKCVTNKCKDNKKQLILCCRILVLRFSLTHVTLNDGKLKSKKKGTQSTTEDEGEREEEGRLTRRGKLGEGTREGG